MTEPSRLSLMAILAHPDDESLGFGGVIATYAAEGVEVSLITATRGEGGRYKGHREGPEHPGREKLAAIREAELKAAATTLGVRNLKLLGYPDGHLDEANPIEVVGRIAEQVRKHRPQVVATFPPDGAYGHPDHIAICQFASAAMVAAADPAHESGGRESLPPHAVAKLYYMAATEASWGVYQGAVTKLSSRVDGVERQVVSWPEWEITTEVDTRASWATVWKAVCCHESQIAGYGRLKQLSPDQHAELWGCQRYYRAFSTVNGGRRRETDLFEGLRP